MEPIENCSGVYLIVNSVNGHSYVGSSANVIKRVWSHLEGTKGSAIVAAAIRKHGRDNFFAFLLERADRVMLPIRESFWIENLTPEYNASRLTDTGGKIVLPEQRKKISESLRGRKLSAEHRSKISTGMIGRVPSPETKAKIVAALIGRKHRPESILKMGRPMTPERRQKISAAATGRVISDESRAKKSAALKGKPWSARRRAAQK